MTPPVLFSRWVPDVEYFSPAEAEQARAALADAEFAGCYIGVDKETRFAVSSSDCPEFEIRFVCGNIHEVDLESDFDLLFSLSALEHIPEDAPLIQRVRGLLKPTGGHRPQHLGVAGVPLARVPPVRRGVDRRAVRPGEHDALQAGWAGELSFAFDRHHRSGDIPVPIAQAALAAIV